MTQSGKLTMSFLEPLRHEDALRKNELRLVKLNFLMVSTRYICIVIVCKITM